MPVKSIKKLFESDHAVGALYVGLAGAIAGELLPTPSDPIDFWLERKWRVQLENGEITPKKYWNLIALKYYGLDTIWWSAVLLTAILVKGDVRRKAMVVGGVVGAGIAIGVIGKNIQKDTEYFSKYKLVKK